MKPSIRHNPAPTALPDFRNLGVWLRLLLGVNLLALLWVLARNTAFATIPDEFVDLALWVEPVLFVLLPLLHVLQPSLTRLRLSIAHLVVLGLAVVVTLCVHVLLSGALGLALTPDTLLRATLWSSLAGLAMLGYFAWLSTLYSPALTEARLLALTARIRPHFLYNSLNAVLGVIRHDPRRAETALEELSDLFRALMQENRELVLLSDEIALARQYLELERLRLGERLNVIWQVEACPPDTLMPPLMLQPLLENAVCHGIEPSTVPAAITIDLGMNGNRLWLQIRNPLHAGSHGHGNHMALANIRERLMLFYDLEANLDTREENGEYRVRIELPLRQRGRT